MKHPSCDKGGCTNPAFTVIYPDDHRREFLGVKLCWPCRKHVLDTKSPRSALYRAASKFVSESLRA